MAKDRKYLEDRAKQNDYSEHDADIIYVKKCIEGLEKSIEDQPKKLAAAMNEVAKTFKQITGNLTFDYSYCIKKHRHPSAFYQRSRIFFDQGKSQECVDDIFNFIEMGNEPTPVMDLALGKAYGDANLYNQAIKALSDAIQKDPQLKEAYLERAVAYFETGDLQLALSDYLACGMRPTILHDRNYQHFVFSVGVGLGCLKGGVDSAVEFVPSLFSTIYGLGKGLWTLAADPVGISKELIDEALSCIEYIRNNLTSELLATLVPELKECIQKWNQLEEDKKGYDVGYIIGRYGVDALICGSSMRAIQIYRNLKKANTILTLEAAIASPTNAASFTKASEEFFIKRNEFKKQCKLHLGQQEKHIPGANNFQSGAGKGELTISVERLEKITASKLGEGMPVRFSFGEAGYKETVEFEEVIGLHIDKQTKAKVPTTVGDIHYDTNGGYHVVPMEPNKMQRLLDKRKHS